jgi:hypothetical protein
MEVPFPKNFKDYVALMAANSPHALVMDWWRRLDLALREYADAFKPVVALRNRRAIEEAVSMDRVLGPGFADCVRRLRLLRNQVAHEPIYHRSSEDAAAYARHAFTLIACLGRRVSRLESTNRRLAI